MSKCLTILIFMLVFQCLTSYKAANQTGCTKPECVEIGNGTVAVCPNGTFGPNCSNLCPSEYFGTACKQKCNCTEDEICNYVIGCTVNDTDGVTPENTMANAIRWEYLVTATCVFVLLMFVLGSILMNSITRNENAKNHVRVPNLRPLPDQACNANEDIYDEIIELDNVYSRLQEDESLYNELTLKRNVLQNTSPHTMHGLYSRVNLEGAYPQDFASSSLPPPYDMQITGEICWTENDSYVMSEN